MIFSAESTVSDIVRSDYRTAEVFKKHGINFCCSGQVSLEAACSTCNLLYDDVVKELETETRNIKLHNRLEFDKWSIDFLIDFITNVHHAYLYQTIPEIEMRLLSFLNGHAKKYPELKNIYESFIHLSEYLVRHNKSEEEITFPYIKQIDKAYRKQESYGKLFVRTLRKPLSTIGQEHDIISSLLLKLKQYTNNYTFPEKACTNHQVVYQTLKEFNDDLVQHKHLENNILFPKAIQIEKELLQL